MEKLPYEAPSLTRWGSISDLTQGTGQTNDTDDFETCPPQMEAFVGSNDTLPPPMVCT
jgi:hypothetical protein